MVIGAAVPLDELFQFESHNVAHHALSDSKRALMDDLGIKSDHVRRNFRSNFQFLFSFRKE